ncbi:Alpha/Beta hydrolase protein [Hyaloraphidium curvatum]|nr:Alpha/Beta hydrolase protein [Hyaloraphidium curvatum]
MLVELVSVTTSDGFRLDGALRAPAAAKDARGLPADALIAIHGATGNFYGESFFSRVSDELSSRGCAVLRINNRGHDFAYPVRNLRGFMGTAFEVIDDSRKDLQAWLDFLESRGYKRIAVWGHSLGAVKTVYSIATDADPRVVLGLASSPPRFYYATHADSSYGPEFKSNIARAEELLREGKPEELMRVAVPLPGLFSSATYRDKYGPEDRYDFLPLLEKLPVPMLVTLGGEETQTYYIDLRREGPDMAKKIEKLEYKVIEGADHLYTDKYGELWEAAWAWMEGLPKA